MRGYVIKVEIPENATDHERLVAQAKEEIVKGLSRQWNQVNAQIERYQWDDHAREMEDDLFQERAYEEFCSRESALGRDLTKEERDHLREQVNEEMEAQRDAYINGLHAKREALESVLRDYNARMMRPYEHWNEEERYMQYMEQDRWSGRDDY